MILSELVDYHRFLLASDVHSRQHTCEIIDMGDLWTTSAVSVAVEYCKKLYANFHTFCVKKELVRKRNASFTYF